MSQNPIRQIHSEEPLPIDHVVRMANRLSLETLLMIVAYTAILLSVVGTLQWMTVFLAILCAVGIYHARLKVCAADYYGRRPPVGLSWLWPVQSMVVVAGLMVIGCLCLSLSLAVTLGVVYGFMLLIVDRELAIVMTAFVGTLPGSMLGTLIATAVVTRLGKSWLRLT
jgi:hypothetical protein